MSIDVLRLTADHAPAIRDCFEQVYGNTYANGVFYDTSALAEAIALAGALLGTFLEGDGLAVVGNIPAFGQTGLQRAIGPLAQQSCVKLAISLDVASGRRNDRVKHRNLVGRCDSDWPDNEGAETGWEDGRILVQFD